MCRAPLLNTQHSKAELAALYRLHLEQAEVPADFGTLLQLRQGRGAVPGELRDARLDKFNRTSIGCSLPHFSPRALLDMDFEEAERIEREVAEQSAFSI